MNPRKSLRKVISISDVFYLLIFLSALVSLFVISDNTIRLITGSIALLDLILFAIIISKRFDTYIFEESPRQALAGLNRNIGNIRRPFTSNSNFMHSVSLDNSESISNHKSDSSMENNDIGEIVNKPTTNNEEFSSVRIVGKLKKDYSAEKNDSERKIPTEPEKSIIENDDANANVDVPDSLQLNAFFDEETIVGNDPKREFDFVISKLLLIFKMVSKTKTAIFFMVSPDRTGFMIQSFASDNIESFTKKRHFENGSDLISKIILSKSHQLIDLLNPAATQDLLPYYDSKADVMSFVGVPVVYKDEVIGVIAADSLFENAFSEVTVKFLANFSKIISASIQGFVHKFDLIQASKTLDAIKAFNAIAYDLSGNQNISGAIAETLNDTFENTRVGVCGYSEASDSWHFKSYKSKSADNIYKVGDNINMNDSAIGKSIIDNSTVAIEIDDNSPIRINQNDKKIEFGHFIAVPIKSPDNTFGALFIEREFDKSFTLFEISLLEIIASQAATAIERIHILEALRNAAMFDINTGILNSKAFHVRLDEEIHRANDFKIPITLCIFKVDKYASLNFDTSNISDYIVHNIVNIVNRHIAVYDLFGRIEHDTFGILLAGTTTDNAKIWAERLRNSIANNIIEIENQKFSVTISMGIAKYEENDNIESFLSNAQKVIQIAEQRTNCVIVYN